MLVDVIGLKDIVSIQINNTIKYLDKGNNVIKTIKVPNDFSYKGELNTISNKILTVNSEFWKINSWMSSTINNFQDVEKKNVCILSNLISAIPTSPINGGVAATAASTVKFLEPSDFYKEIKKNFNSLLDFASSSKLLTKSIDISQKTASEVRKNVVSAIFLPLNTGAKFINETKNLYSDKIKPSYDSINTKISKYWNFANKKVLPILFDIQKTNTASSTNLCIGFLKGVCEFEEALEDTICLIGTATASVFTGGYDANTYLYALITGKTDEWNSFTVKMWEDSMGYVADKRVESTFKDFYYKNEIGKWLDKYALDACKSDGWGTDIAEGIGYTTGIILLALATAGLGTTASGSGAASTTMINTISSYFAGAAGFGKGVQNKWAEARDNTWAGIVEKYKKGYITKEQYNSLKKIRNLSDEEWNILQSAYEKNVISEEKFQQMKQIREMPEDWKNFDNALKGLGYGAGKGIFDWVLWFLPTKEVSNSQYLDDVARIAFTTTAAIIEQPAVAAWDSLTTDQTFQESWEAQGGWDTFRKNLIKGILIGLGGKGVDLFKNIFNSSEVDAVVNSINNESIYREFLTATLQDEGIETLGDIADGIIDSSSKSEGGSSENISKDDIDLMLSHLENNIKDTTENETLWERKRKKVSKILSIESELEERIKDISNEIQENENMEEAKKIQQNTPEKTKTDKLSNNSHKKEDLEKNKKNASDEMPERSLENIQEDISDGLKEERSEDIKDNSSEEIPEEASEGIQDNSPEEIREEALESVKENNSEDIPEGVSESVQESNSEEISGEEPQNIQENNSEEIQEKLENVQENISEEIIEENLEEDSSIV